MDLFKGECMVFSYSSMHGKEMSRTSQVSCNIGNVQGMPSNLHTGNCIVHAALACIRKCTGNLGISWDRKSARNVVHPVHFLHQNCIRKFGFPSSE